MGFVVALIFGIIPTFLFAAFVYWLDRYESEPKILLGSVYIWGAVVAAGVACTVNSLFEGALIAATGAKTAADLTTSAIIAPLIEESLKGFAVLLVFLVFHNEFDSILDGIVYASITALGFAATENTLYIYNGYLEQGWSGLFFMSFVRIVLVGWQHPFYTSFTGIGLAMARLQRNGLVKFLAPLIGLVTAITIHSIHNIISSLVSGFSGVLATTTFDWVGWLFMLAFILWIVHRERLLNIRELKEEVVLGSITQQQYQIACSSWSQSVSRLSALFRGNYRQTIRLYQLCGELAHKKQQLARFGDEDGNTILIEKLRGEMRRLSSLVN
jgi:RsiW-degrading membrane proteinase PrsW (M82 family)